MCTMICLCPVEMISKKIHFIHTCWQGYKPSIVKQLYIRKTRTLPYTAANSIKNSCKIQHIFPIIQPQKENIPCNLQHGLKKYFLKTYNNPPAHYRKQKEVENNNKIKQITSLPNHQRQSSALTSSANWHPNKMLQKITYMLKSSCTY